MEAALPSVCNNNFIIIKPNIVYQSVKNEEKYISEIPLFFNKDKVCYILYYIQFLSSSSDSHIDVQNENVLISIPGAITEDGN